MKRNEALHTALKCHWWSNGRKWRAFSSKLTRILQEWFHIAVLAQTVQWVRQKLGWRWSGTKNCQLVKDINNPKRVQHCLNILHNEDTFYDVIFTDECLVKIEWYTGWSFLKVGQQHRGKGQPKHLLKVLFCFISSLYMRNLSIQVQLVHPFPHLKITCTCCQ